jgi:hypothetical protein
MAGVLYPALHLTQLVLILGVQQCWQHQMSLQHALLVLTLGVQQRRQHQISLQHPLLA